LTQSEPVRELFELTVSLTHHRSRPHYTPPAHQSEFTDYYLTTMKRSLASRLFKDIPVLL